MSGQAAGLSGQWDVSRHDASRGFKCARVGLYSPALAIPHAKSMYRELWGQGQGETGEAEGFEGVCNEEKND